MSQWIEYPSFWLNTSPQKSKEWLDLRRGRLTTTTIAKALGLCRQFGYDAEKTAREIAGLEKPLFSQKSLDAMKKGVELEPLVREWYCQRNPTFKVQEVGIAISKFNRFLSGSSDGVVFTSSDQTLETAPGIIEIKTTANGKLYSPLKERISDDKIEYDPFDHRHIWISHYIQFQSMMKIMNKQWCDYIVYAEKEGYFLQRFPFDEKYWNSFLEPQINEFIKDKLLPLIDCKKIGGPPNI